MVFSDYDTTLVNSRFGWTRLWQFSLSRLTYVGGEHCLLNKSIKSMMIYKSTTILHFQSTGVPGKNTIYNSTKRALEIILLTEKSVVYNKYWAKSRIYIYPPPPTPRRIQAFMFQVHSSSVR